MTSQRGRRIGSAGTGHENAAVFVFFFFLKSFQELHHIIIIVVVSILPGGVWIHGADIRR